MTVLILALDTTTRGGSVALVDNDRVTALVEGDESRTHGERLPGEIAVALERAGVSRRQIDLLAVAAGPGGFTGLRIGLAAIQGLAMTLGKPVAGVSTLDALVAQAAAGEDSDDELIVPWMDAQRGDVFASIVDACQHAMVEDAVAEQPARLLVRWQNRLAGRRVVFIGDAVTRDELLIARAATGPWRTQTPAPLAPQIAVLGRRLAEQGLAGLPHALAPIYVRRPDAEIERDRRVAGGAHGNAG
jgi:tRNA threonylcarbamoyladenosine biosynthesis protein TsaB